MTNQQRNIARDFRSYVSLLIYFRYKRSELTSRGLLIYYLRRLILSLLFWVDTDRARKHGMEEFIAADPVTAAHHGLFSDLQKWSLDWRLKDPFASLVNIDIFHKLSIFDVREIKFALFKEVFNGLKG